MHPTSERVVDLAAIAILSSPNSPELGHLVRSIADASDQQAYDFAIIPAPFAVLTVVR